MIDASAEARAARLRQIAAGEIARHREAQGYLGAALEGSLATGAIWPTSDLDFTVVPCRDSSPEQWVEWEQRESLPFLKEHPDQRTHIVVCGQREGIPWHKHITDSRALLDMVEAYPASFIRPAVGPFDLEATWFLDGLAVMEVVDDPEGLLGHTRQFVATRRFAAEVWDGRRVALLQELRRQRDMVHEAMVRGEVDATYQLLSSETGFAAVAAQLWLESAQRICSRKEQDGQLAEVARAAGHPEAHALYRHALAVEPERAQAVVPLLLQLGEQAAPLYHSMATLPPEDPERRRDATVWGAYISHLAGTLSLAPDRGHPAYVYQSLGSISHWAADYPAQIIEELRGKEVPGAESLHQQASVVAGLAEQIRTTLLDPLQAIDRTRHCLAAADKLLDLTEARL
jgi:predicted nucleotidyltransferase